MAIEGNPLIEDEDEFEDDKRRGVEADLPVGRSVQTLATEAW
jgi:hypothetical protein